MNDSREFRTGRHCVFNLHAHLVFVTKYRHDVLQGYMFSTLEMLFSKVCTDFEAQLMEMNGEGDHVHLLVNYPPKVSLSKLVNSLKGVSSRKLKLHHPEVAGQYYKSALWSPSYFVSSCGGAPLDIIQQYVKQQQRPH